MWPDEHRTVDYVHSCQTKADRLLYKRLRCAHKSCIIPISTRVPSALPIYATDCGTQQWIEIMKITQRNVSAIYIVAQTLERVLKRDQLFVCLFEKCYQRTKSHSVHIPRRPLNAYPGVLYT